MVDLLESLSLVTYGFLLGLLGPPISEWLMRRVKRGRLAVVLQSELEAIDASARHSIEVNTPSVAEARKEFQRTPQSVNYIEIGDADFPSVVFNSAITEIEILGSDLVVAVTEVYRWIGYAHHHKRENLKQAEDVKTYLATSMNRSLTSVELSYLRLKAGGSIHYAEIYLEVVEKVEKLATSALEELWRIKRPSQRQKVSVRLRQVHRETLP